MKADKTIEERVKVNGEYDISDIVTVQKECLEKLGELIKNVDYDIYMDWVMLLIKYNDLLADEWRRYNAFKLDIWELKGERWNELRVEQKSNVATDKLVDEEFKNENRLANDWRYDLEMLDRKYNWYSVKGMKVWGDYFYRMQREVEATK